MTTINLRELTKVYGQGTGTCCAVDHVDLDIDSGEFFFLLGPSGCGKTTLLRMLAGLVTPTGGKVLFDGREVTDEPVHRRNTAMVFQNYALWPHMTVRANVEFGPRMQRLSPQERRTKARTCLTMVRMGQLGERKPRQLSGGQQQRVALARALAAEPACLLLDEPLSNLDAQLRLQMREQLREIIKTAGTTAVYVTHDQKEALAMADRMAVMKDGRIIQVGRPDELYERPASRFVAEFVGEANFIDGQVKRDEAGSVWVETRAGPISVAPDTLLEGGQTVTCCIRPEHIALAPWTPHSEITGSVLNRTYQGETVQYRVELTSGDIWKALAFGRRDGAEIHQKAVLRISPDAVILLRD